MDPQFRIRKMGSPDAYGTTSLPVGTGYVAEYCFIKANGQDLATNPVFDSADDFKRAFTKAFQEYNPGKRGYGADVTGFAPQYLPIPATAIFSGQ